MVDAVLSAGLQGIQNGVGSARQAADDIVRATTTNPNTTPSPTENSGRSSIDTTADLTTAVVELKASEQQVQASAAVIKTADEVLGTLIDTSA